jgi:hypothetical protein
VERAVLEPKAAITAPATPRFFKAVRREKVSFDFMLVTANNTLRLPRIEQKN